VRTGLRLPPCRPVPEVADAARAAEAAGFTDLWVPDSQTLWRDPFVTLAAIAGATRRVRLGTAVTNVVTRHPSVVASAARTVAELAPGRFVLGVGVGNSAVEPVGLRSSTHAGLRAGLAALRDGLAPAVPLHVAASGPRNLALAGEAADGAILLAGASPALVSAAVTRVRAAARRAGRPEPEVTVSAFCRVTDDPERDSVQLKPVCAELARKGGGAALRAAGLAIDVPAVIPGVVPDVLHARDWDAAVRVCSAWVSDEDAARFAAEFCLYGSASAIRARIAGLARLGVTGVLLQHVGSYTLPHELISGLDGQLAAGSGGAFTESPLTGPGLLHRTRNAPDDPQHN
jgi:5,10-methylenetetrahydromethanopterin reductase